MGKHLTSRALLAVMLATFGVHRSSALLGWAGMLALAGIEPTARALLASGIGSQAQRYRTVAAYRELADVLRAEGYDLTPEEVLAVACRQPVVAR
jgi:hypothetical protein